MAHSDDPQPVVISAEHSPVLLPSFRSWCVRHNQSEDGGAFRCDMVAEVGTTHVHFRFEFPLEEIDDRLEHRLRKFQVRLTPQGLILEKILLDMSSTEPKWYDIYRP